MGSLKLARHILARTLLLAGHALAPTQQVALSPAALVGPPARVIFAGDLLADPVTRHLSRAEVASMQPVAPDTQAVTAYDVLRFIKHAELELEVPLEPGRLMRGLEVRPNTTVKVRATVRDGQLDLERAQVEIRPSLDGPAWVNVRGLYADSRGYLRARISGFPDLILGSKLPTDLRALADIFEQQGAAAEWTTVRLGSRKLASAPGPAAVKDRLTSSLRNAQLVLGEIELADGPVTVGRGVVLAVEPGSRAQLRGTADNLTLSVDAGLQQIELEQEGFELQGGRGRAQVEVVYQRDADGKVGLTTEVRGLELETSRVQLTGADGSSLKLGEGRITGGQLRLRDVHAPRDSVLGTRAGRTLESLQLSFSGQIEEAHKELRAEFGSARLRVGPSWFEGTAQVREGVLTVDGTVDLDARLQRVRAGAGAVRMSAQEIALSGRGHLTLTDQGALRLSGRDLQVQAVLGDTRFEVGDGFSFALRDGARLRGSGVSLSHDQRGLTFSLSRPSEISAELESGHLQLARGQRIRFGTGSLLRIGLEQLQLGPQTAPSLRGQLSLQGQLDHSGAVAPAAEHLGLSATTIEGLSQRLNVEVGGFRLEPNGDFEMNEVRVGVEATVDRLGGSVRRNPT
jgi:hypothetical protein